MLHKFLAGNPSTTTTPSFSTTSNTDVSTQNTTQQLPPPPSTTTSSTTPRFNHSTPISAWKSSAADQHTPSGANTAPASSSSDPRVSWDDLDASHAKGHDTTPVTPHKDGGAGDAAGNEKSDLHPSSSMKKRSFWNLSGVGVGRKKSKELSKEELDKLRGRESTPSSTTKDRVRVGDGGEEARSSERLHGDASDSDYSDSRDVKRGGVSSKSPVMASTKKPEPTKPVPQLIVSNDGAGRGGQGEDLPGEEMNSGWSTGPERSGTDVESSRRRRRRRKRRHSRRSMRRGGEVSEEDKELDGRGEVGGGDLGDDLREGGGGSRPVSMDGRGGMGVGEEAGAAATGAGLERLVDNLRGSASNAASTLKRTLGIGNKDKEKDATGGGGKGEVPVHAGSSKMFGIPSTEASGKSNRLSFTSGRSGGADGALSDGFGGVEGGDRNEAYGVPLVTSTTAPAGLPTTPTGEQGGVLTSVDNGGNANTAAGSSSSGSNKTNPLFRLSLRKAKSYEHEDGPPLRPLGLKLTTFNKQSQSQSQDPSSNTAPKSAATTSTQPTAPSSPLLGFPSSGSGQGSQSPPSPTTSAPNNAQFLSATRIQGGSDLLGVSPSMPHSRILGGLGGLAYLGKRRKSNAGPFPASGENASNSTNSLGVAPDGGSNRRLSSSTAAPSPGVSPGALSTSTLPYYGSASSIATGTDSNKEVGNRVHPVFMPGGEEESDSYPHSDDGGGPGASTKTPKPDNATWKGGIDAMMFKQKKIMQ
ncbi:hypothetical protein HK102_008472, partial [Quaeritorhiza haematococci]